MRKAIIGFMSVGFLFSAGCSAPPAGNSPTPKASQTVSTTTTTVTTSSPVPASTATATASPSPAATVTVTPSASGTPGASGTPAAPSAAAKKIADDTGIAFAVPSGYTEAPQSDGELQLNGKEGEFVALQSGDDLDKTFDATVTMMKKVGDKSFKEDGPAQTKESEGLKGKIQMGKMEVKGKAMEWVIAVVQGKKAFRVAAIGPSLKASPDFEALMNSVKKQ